MKTESSHPYPSGDPADHQGTIGERIKLARLQRNITMKELESSSGVIQSTISKIETNRISDIAGKSVLPLADALGVSARWLLTGKSSKESSDLAWPPQRQPALQRLVDHLDTLTPEKCEALAVLLGVRISDL